MVDDTNNEIELIHSEALLKFSNTNPTDISFLNNKLSTIEEEAFVHSVNDNTQLEYLPKDHIIKVKYSDSGLLEMKGDILKFTSSEKNNNELLVQFLAELNPFSNDYSEINLSLNDPDVQLTLLTLNPVTVINILEKLVKLNLNIQAINQSIANSDTTDHEEHEVINQQNTSLTSEDISIEDHNNFAIL